MLIEQKIVDRMKNPLSIHTPYLVQYSSLINTLHFGLLPRSELALVRSHYPFACPSSLSRSPVNDVVAIIVLFLSFSVTKMRNYFCCCVFASISTVFVNCWIFSVEQLDVAFSLIENKENNF